MADKKGQIQASIHLSSMNKPSLSSPKNAGKDPSPPKSTSPKEASKRPSPQSKDGSTEGSSGDSMDKMIADMKKRQNLSKSGSKMPTNAVSKLRLFSLSNATSAKLARNPFTVRDGLIGVVGLIVVVVYTFFGAGVTFEIERVTGHDDSMPCPGESSCECSFPNATSDVDQRFITELKNETESYHECLFEEVQKMETSTFENGVIYTFTIMTTIGYGQLIASGYASEGVVIVCAFFAIPLFDVFILYVCQAIRDHFAYWYDRLIGRRQEANILRRCSNKCPKLLPFVIMLVITAAYLFATAGIFIAATTTKEKKEFSGYFDAFYYLFQSATAIGFGDQLPFSFTFQVIAIPFIVLSIVLMRLSQTIPEEWTEQIIVAIIDLSSCKAKKVVDKPLAEQTLEEMMALGPDEQPFSPKPPAIERTDIEIPTSLKKISSRRTQTVHSKQFSISLAKIMNADDEPFEMGQPELM